MMQKILPIENKQASATLHSPIELRNSQLLTPTREPVLPPFTIRDDKKREEEAGRDVALRQIQKNRINQEEPMSSPADAGDNGDGWKRDYDPKEFVGREKELTLVQDKVELGQMGAVINSPLINFWGAGGQGKTWLLKHLETTYQFAPKMIAAEDTKPTLPIYFDVEKYTEEKYTLQVIILELLQYLKLKLEGEILFEEQQKNIEKVERSGDPRQLANLIAMLSKKVVVLLLLDTTEAVNKQLWYELEEEFLEPILEKDRVIVIISGRRRTPRWQRVEVRRRTVPSEEGLLKPFDIGLLSKQLEKLSFPQPKYLANQIFNYTSGNPALSRVLAEYIQKIASGDSHDKITLANLDGFEDKVIQVFKAYEKDVFAGIISAYQRLITAVLPLRTYRISALKWMLQNQSDQSEKVDSDVKLLTNLRKMEKETDIVWWEDKHNGYETAPIVRRVLDCERRLETPELFKQQHELALKLYWQWAKDFPEHSAVYLVEICFHQATLDKQLISKPESITGFEEVVTFVKEKLSADQGMILPARIQKDDELRNLLTLEQYDKLIGELDTILSVLEL